MGEAVTFLVEVKQLQSFNFDANDPDKIFVVTAVDKSGKPAPIDGKQSFTVSPEGGVLLLPNDSGSELTVQFVSPMTQVVTVSADADVSPTGTKLITGQFEIVTTGSLQADHFTVTEKSIV